MKRFITEFGTVVETDRPQPGWRPTDDAATATGAPEKESSVGDIAKTAGESFASGALGLVTAPLSLAGQGIQAVTGVPNALADLSGRKILHGAAYALGGSTEAAQYDEAARARAEANPTTAALGSAAGQIAGALATGGASAAVGRVATARLGGGLAARALGAGAAGAVEGAGVGLSSAEDQAFLQRQHLDGEHALAATGLGALFGGGLRFAGKLVGDGVATAAGPLEDFADKAPGVVGGQIARAAPGIADKVVRTGLKVAGLSHGVPGYFLGEAAGEQLAPKVAGAIARNSGVIGEMAQKGARLAASAIGSVTEGTGAKVATATLPGATSVFMGDRETMEDAYGARIAQLERLAANNGQGIRDAVATSLGPIAHEQPGAFLGMTQAANAGVQYLIGKIPSVGIAENSLTPLSSSQPPPRAEMASFARVYAAIMQPKTVLRDIKNGTVTSDQIDAVKTVYPDWFQHVIVQAYGDRLRRIDAKGKTLAPNQNRVANMVLGTSTGLDSVDLALQVGSAFVPKAQPKPAGGAGRKTKQQTTPTDTVLGQGRQS